MFHCHTHSQTSSPVNCENDPLLAAGQGKTCKPRATSWIKVNPTMISAFFRWGKQNKSHHMGRNSWRDRLDTYTIWNFLSWDLKKMNKNTPGFISPPPKVFPVFFLLQAFCEALLNCCSLECKNTTKLRWMQFFLLGQGSLIKLKCNWFCSVNLSPAQLARWGLFVLLFCLLCSWHHYT